MALDFILTDLQGVVQGEVMNASDSSVTLPHLRVPSATLRIPLYHDLADFAVNNDSLLKVYHVDATEARTLIFNGPVVTAEEVGANLSQTIALTAAGPYWRLTKRLIPASKVKAGFAQGTTSAPVDVGLIAHNILDNTNSDFYTGIERGTRIASVGGVVGPWWNKIAAEGIAELSAGLGTFEMEVAPNEPMASTQFPTALFPRIGTLNVAPLIGTSRPDAIFEFGSGRSNVTSYNRTVDRTGLLTRGTITVQGWPDAPPKRTVAPFDLLDQITISSDQVNTRGLFEELVPDGGIIEDSLRTSLLNFHLGIRKNPRQIITFTLAPNAVPTPFVDYVVGDTVRARATVRGVTRFDASFRVWGMNLATDKQGNQTTALDLVVP